jgi:hypothetical protein
MSDGPEMSKWRCDVCRGEEPTTLNHVFTVVADLTRFTVTKGLDPAAAIGAQKAHACSVVCVGTAFSRWADGKPLSGAHQSQGEPPPGSGQEKTA